MIPTIPHTRLKQICDSLADAVTHSELIGIFRQCGIDVNGGEPKWERMLLALEAKQKRDGCGNNVGAFIQAVADPARFAYKQKEFDQLKERLNIILTFDGIKLGEDGKLVASVRSKSLSEAHDKANRLQAELVRRKVHPDVLRFCSAEFLQENYFHAVFEATKSVADKIRQMTGELTDGSELVRTALNVQTPLLAINSLQTETEKSEQKGFANLLNGIFGTFRNVTAHAPKILWPIGEQDALDLLSFVSYAHRRLDGAVRVPQIISQSDT